MNKSADAFPLVQSDPLYEAHKLLNEYLSTEVRDLERFVPDSRWKKLPKRQTIDMIEAVLRRFTWLREHDAEFEDGHVSRIKLVKLLRVFYSRKLPCTESDLRMMLDLTVPLFESIAPDGPVDFVMEYLKENDLTPELCISLHHFQENLLEQGSVAAMQSLRQRLHTTLWMDEWEPLDPKLCWSESIRQDFRAMTGDRRKHWRHLLKHIRGNAPTNMPASWAREAEQLIANVGVDDFCEQLSLWFSPPQSSQPFSLSVAGSHILKGLVWYAAVSLDKRAKQSSLGLLDLKWKQKRNIPKLMVALGVFGVSKDELLSRNLIKEPTPQRSRMFESILDILRQPIASTHIVADPEGDVIIVQGQLHFYRLFRSTGRIERVSDNAVLELDWASIPDSMRLYLHQECDSAEQLQLRATMLMHDSINGKYFKASQSSER